MLETGAKQSYWLQTTNEKSYTLHRLAPYWATCSFTIITSWNYIHGHKSHNSFCDLECAAAAVVVVVVIAQQLFSYRHCCPGWGSLRPQPGCPTGLALGVASDGFDSWTECSTECGATPHCSRTDNDQNATGREWYGLSEAADFQEMSGGEAPRTLFGTKFVFLLRLFGCGEYVGSLILSVCRHLHFKYLQCRVVSQK